MEKKGALHGITVLDISRMLPGPFCTMVLADHGARVITIEDKRFEKEGSFPPSVNRNKEHMTLNLKSREGKEIFYRLVGNADILVEGFRPGVAARLGVDYDTLKEKNPGLIYCSISGYGQTGPLRDRPGHDVNYLGVSGLLDQIGPKDGAPTIPGFQIADIAGGGLHGALGILLALFDRTRTGRGQFIDIAMTDCCLPMLAVNMDLQRLTGERPKRSDAFLSHGYAFYNTFETRDGKYLTLGALEPHFWNTLCDHLGVPPHLSCLQLNKEKQGEIKAFMEDTFKKKDRHEWELELDQLPICWGPVNTLEEAMESEVFSARQMVVETVAPNGDREKTFGVPIKMSETPGSIRSTPVGFGESTVKILEEVEFSRDDIDAFFTKEII
ncbi:MAG: CoA transferase [Desulfobacterium sp.]|nr:CoA transferase [Desulfobacterium sp.]